MERKGKLNGGMYKLKVADFEYAAESEL